MTAESRKDLISRETVRMDKSVFVAIVFWVIFGSSAVALRIKLTLFSTPTSTPFSPKLKFFNATIKDCSVERNTGEESSGY
jgi:uncharacterized membrane protein